VGGEIEDPERRNLPQKAFHSLFIFFTSVYTNPSLFDKRRGEGGANPGRAM
jgi:hypothetical protein